MGGSTVTAEATDPGSIGVVNSIATGAVRSCPVTTVVRKAAWVNGTIGVGGLAEVVAGEPAPITPTPSSPTDGDGQPDSRDDRPANQCADVDGGRGSGRPASRRRPCAIDDAPGSLLLGTASRAGPGPTLGCRAGDRVASASRGPATVPNGTGLAQRALDDALSALGLRIGAGEGPGRAEPTVNAECQAPALEQGQRRQHAGDRPARRGHELVDGRPAEDQLAPDRARRRHRRRRVSQRRRSGRRARRDDRQGRGRRSAAGCRPRSGRPPRRTRAGTTRQPAEAGASIAPGTRKHSRPCSSAQDAVISAPLRAGASTTTVASASPLITRLRRGNVPCVGSNVRRQLGDDGAAGTRDRRGQALVDPWDGAGRDPSR